MFSIECFFNSFIYRQRASSWQTITNPMEVAKFDGVTINSETYRQWPIPARRQLHGDRYETPFAPSTSHFDARTTNSLTYRGEQLPVADRVQPAGVPNGSRGISGPGQTRNLLEGPDAQSCDFDTAYRSDFNRPNAVRLLTKSQALLLLQALRERKRKRDASAAAVEDIVAAAAATKPKGPKKTSLQKVGVTVRAKWWNPTIIRREEKGSRVIVRCTRVDWNREIELRSYSL